MLFWAQPLTPFTQQVNLAWWKYAGLSTDEELLSFKGYFRQLPIGLKFQLRKKLDCTRQQNRVF